MYRAVYIENSMYAAFFIWSDHVKFLRFGKAERIYPYKEAGIDMKKMLKGAVLIIGCTILGVGILGGVPGPSGRKNNERVYAVKNVTLEAFGNNSLNTYNFQYIEKKCNDDGTITRKIYDAADYRNEEAGGMKDVKFAIDCPYGYKDCYVVDEQQNECLYLTKETYAKIRGEYMSRNGY